MATTSTVGLTQPTGTATSLGATPVMGQVTGQEQTLAGWAAPYISNMLGQTQALAQTPYRTYGGPLTAGPSSLQQQYFQGLGSMGFPSQLGKSVTQPGVMQSYMNPYMQQVLEPQLQAIQRQGDIDRNMIGAKAATMGGLGGARAGLMNQQLNADIMRQKQQATGTAYDRAYSQGLGQFNAEQQQGQQQAQLIGGAGAQQRDITQQGVAADLAEFERQRQFPYQQLQFQQSMLQGMPITATNNQYAQESKFSELIGTLTGLEALYRRLFPNG